LTFLWRLTTTRRNKRFDTPHNAIYASLIIIFVLIKFEFDEILGMTNALSAFYQLLILGAFIKMRYSHKEVDRPFKGTRMESLDASGLRA
jgi:amino acid transporter